MERKRLFYEEPKCRLKRIVFENVVCVSNHESTAPVFDDDDSDNPYFNS